MEVTFDVNELEGMKRAELQKLCKSVGIKANMKNAQLIEALRGYSAQISGNRKRYSIAEKKQSLQNTCALVKEAEKTDEQQGADDNESYKKQLMDQLEKKVEEKMPVECKIPRFVQFANKGKFGQDTKKTPAAKWSKIHNSQFEKMDSIDVYLEKKRKRMEGFNQSVKRAKSVGVNRRSNSKPAEVPTFKPINTTLSKSTTFVFGSPTAKPFFQPGNKNVSIATTGTASGKKLKLKSPKVFKPTSPGSAVTSGKAKMPNTRRTIAVTTALENKPKTPANPARKSTAVTPFRFLPANIPAAPTPTPKKKFDLKASLAKPLSYKPHTGKLKPVSSYKEECRPTISKAKLRSRKVDVKTAKVTTREERCMKENKSRENKRANALSRRRGLAC